MRRFSEKCLIGFFLLFITIPALGLFIKKDYAQFLATFKRDPTPFPQISIKRLGRTNFKAIESWFADKALFITSLSRLWSNANYELGYSTKPNQAVVGKNGWLFLGNDYVATINQYTGADEPSARELRSLYAAFANMDRVAKQNGVPFLVAIVPDKHEIYPEYLPDYVKKSPKPSRWDRLETYFKANQIDYVDLRAAELKAKSKGELYLKGDSHWNYLGAYVAYQAITSYLLSKNIASQQLTFDFNPQTTTTTDLAGFLQLTEIQSYAPMPNISQLQVDMIGKTDKEEIPMGAFQGNSKYIIDQTTFENINKAVHNAQSCLLIGDSFSEALSFYVHNDFYDTIRIHPGNKNYSLQGLIDKYRPKLILFEMTQRGLRGYKNDFSGLEAPSN